MTNTQYIENVVSTVDRILLDTSTLMSHGCRQFVQNNREFFLSTGKKLIIPKAVYSEIVRLLRSDSLEKSICAREAAELISSNADIFEVEYSILTEEEISCAFADAQLLSELTLNRSDYNQLLITNDFGLGFDAYGLNHQQSCKGRRVFVCYINKYGEMHCCDCARQHNGKPHKDLPAADIKENSVLEQDLPINTTMPDTIHWAFDWKSGIIGLTSVGILYGLFKGGKVLLNNLEY